MAMLLMRIRTRDDFKRYGTYNQLPEGFKIITQDEFTKGFFHYCFADGDSKQVSLIDDKQVNWNEGGKMHSLKLFNLDYEGCESMGFGMISLDYENLRYFRYGSEARWKKFSAGFAAQFSGDNS